MGVAGPCGPDEVGGGASRRVRNQPPRLERSGTTDSPAAGQPYAKRGQIFAPFLRMADPRRPQMILKMTFGGFFSLFVFFHELKAVFEVGDVGSYANVFSDLTLFVAFEDAINGENPTVGAISMFHAVF